MPLKKLKLTWPLGLYRVAGHSMQPTFQPGDTLLGWKWPRTLRRGRVIVACREGVHIIKRLDAIKPNGDLVLTGDNLADSLDSRQFGGIPPAHVKAVIILKLP